MFQHLRVFQIALSALILPAQAVGQGRDWLLSPLGAGKVAIGMSVEAVYQAHGRENVRVIDLFREGHFDPALQIYLPFEPGTPALVAHITQVCGQYRVNGIDVHSARYRTREGIGVGSTVAEIRRSYPAARLNREEGPSLIVEPLKMTFAVANGGFADSVRVVKTWMWSLIPDSVRAHCRQQ